ncbi:MAG TPA: hypothetical protein VN622_08875 [Clostridia bacterium]|nr:hypothetical protein [Clostridia bacterium]
MLTKLVEKEVSPERSDEVAESKAPYDQHVAAKRDPSTSGLRPRSGRHAVFITLKLANLHGIT